MNFSEIVERPLDVWDIFGESIFGLVLLALRRAAKTPMDLSRAAGARLRVNSTEMKLSRLAQGAAELNGRLDNTQAGIVVIPNYMDVMTLHRSNIQLTM